MLAMVANYSFTVVGSGEFPHAALELEGAWPATMHDSEKIAAAGERRIELIGPASPDVGRWNAAGWMVRDIRSNPAQAAGDEAHRATDDG